ncbi:MAG: hypothetical protein IPG93_04385 [Burkholderiales bacterium]|nr:hypothetical protein [Burkholderiales bacterium]
MEPVAEPTAAPSAAVGNAASAPTSSRPAVALPVKPAPSRATGASAGRQAATDGPIRADDPQLLAGLAGIELGRNSADNGPASAGGVSALELDEIKPVWDGERRAAVIDLLDQLRQPGASAAVGQVLAALQRGDIKPTLGWLADRETAALARMRRDPGTTDQVARSAATSLARQQGAMALGIDNQAALAAFRRVVELDSVDFWSHITIGDLLAQANDAPGSITAYLAAATILRPTALAEPAPVQGTAAAAPPASGTGLAQRLAWQHALLLCEFRMGELHASVGQRDEALLAFQRSLVVAEALLTAEPARPQRQFEVATVSDRVADLLAAQNLSEEALAAHRRSMALAETLAANDPENEPHWQFYLTDKLEHIADLQLTLGHPDLALENYRRGVDLGEKLVTLDVTNDAWLGSTLNLILKLGGTEGLAQTGEERRQLLLHGLELLGRVRSGEIWDNSDEWGDRLREVLNALPHPSDEAEQQDQPQ